MLQSELSTLIYPLMLNAYENLQPEGGGSFQQEEGEKDLVIAIVSIVFRTFS